MKKEKSLKTQQLNTEQIISEQLLHGNIPIKKLAILLTNDIKMANDETIFRDFKDLYNGDVPNIKLDTLKDFFHVESCTYEIAKPENIINSEKKVYKNKICVSVVVDKNINVYTTSGKQKLVKGTKIKLNLKQNYLIGPENFMRTSWDYDSISYQPLNKDNKRSLETNHIESQIKHNQINNEYLQSKVKRDDEKKIKTETEKCIQEIANKDFHCSAFELKEFIEKKLPKEGNIKDKLNVLKDNKQAIEREIIKQRKEHNVKVHNFRSNLITKQKQRIDRLAAIRLLYTNKAKNIKDKLNVLKDNKHAIEREIIKQRKEHNVKVHNFRSNLITKQKQRIDRLAEIRLLYANKAKNLIKKHNRENLQNVECNNKPLINNFFK